jgi:hypothetical protein
LDNPFASPATESAAPAPGLAPADFAESELNFNEVVSLASRVLAARAAPVVILSALISAPGAVLLEGSGYWWPSVADSAVMAGLLVAVGLWESLTTLALTRLTAATLDGRRRGAAGHLGASLAQLPASIAADLLAMLVIMPLLMLLLVPGFIAASRLLFVSYAIAARGAGPVEALRRSNRLVRGRTVRAFGYMVLVYGWGFLMGQLPDLTAQLELSAPLTTSLRVAAQLVGSVANAPVIVLLAVVFLNWDRLEDGLGSART